MTGVPCFNKSNNTLTQVIRYSLRTAFTSPNLESTTNWSGKTLSITTDGAALYRLHPLTIRSVRKRSFGLLP